MPKTEQIRVPDIGDFDAVDVIEVLVSPGDEVEAEDGLITLESEKASMDVPSPMAGTVKEVKVSAGDQVAQGDVIVLLETGEGDGEEDEEAEKADDEEKEKKEPKAEKGKEGKGKKKKKKGEEEREKKVAKEERGKREKKEKKKAGEEKPKKRPADKPEKTPERPQAPSSAKSEADLHAEVLVLGSGPGGYTAAFRAADLGRKVVLVERYPTLGGVCLNVGCIPSKALLHAAKVIDDAREMGERGIRFGEPEIDLDALRSWKEDVVGKLTEGLSQLASRRDVQVVQGTGTFVSEHTLSVETEDGETTTVSFDAAIVAAGSRVIRIPGIPWDDPRMMDSTAALEIEEVPERLLVVGGGIIGLEMASVYEALGSKVTVVEMLDRLMTGADQDLVKPLIKRIEPRYEAIHLETRVAGVEATDDGLEATFEAAGGGEAPEPATFDRVLVAVGRRSNGDRIGAEAAGIEVDERGVIPVDVHQRTNVPHIFAIGDVVGPQLLAHKATHQGKVAAEVASGERSAFDAKVVPAVAYTDPEVAWCGLTEEEAKEEGREVGKGVFPWSASGRALGMARGEGMTKLLFEPETGRLVGGGIVGPSAGDLISEVALAIEMGAVAQDVGLTIHPHPTLSETVAFAAEAFEGTLTELYKPKRKKK